MRISLYKLSFLLKILMVASVFMGNYAFSETPKTPASDHKKMPVKIAPNIPYVDVTHEGKVVRIQRIQDEDNQLFGSYTKTSRRCPPFCIRPIKLPYGVQTVGELELLEFLKTEVEQGKGLLIDSRLPNWHVKGTIPGSISIPFTMFTGGKEDLTTLELLELLGAKEDEDTGDLNYKNVMTLMFFCNGLWCGQSPKAIKFLVKAGYPAEKIYWYRGGMQSWQLLGLTTIIPEKD
ncbi:MAG: rhodanese-like domain-containing protein [Cocleimonas sp.]|nr:rhodanese-like domain-containing protein [Cocleimonas sp.]